MKKISMIILVTMLLSTVLSACTTEVVKTVEVPVEKTVVTTVEVEVPAEPVDKTVIEFWTTDNEEDRVFRKLTCALFLLRKRELHSALLQLRLPIVCRILSAWVLNVCHPLLRMVFWISMQHRRQ